jgi:hypothetical protein
MLSCIQLNILYTTYTFPRTSERICRKTVLHEQHFRASVDNLGARCPLQKRRLKAYRRTKNAVPSSMEEDLLSR